MYILFVAPGLSFGGAERVMTLLANQFIEVGHNVAFLLMSDQCCPAYKLSERIDLLCVGEFNLSKGYENFRIIRRMKEETKKIAPDVIISFFNSTTVFAKFASRKFHIPIIYSERNDPNNNIVGLSAKIFQRLSIKYSDAIVFQTSGARKCYENVVSKRSTIIMNPFQPDNLPEYYKGNRKKEIVNVGRLTKQKNQKLLIKAFSKIVQDYPDYVCSIYGDGPLRQELVSLIDELCLKDRVILKGNSDDIYHEINESSIFAFTSDFEGLPNALIEAMALGLPCISTDCSPGGARELIRNEENGLLIPCGDENALTQALALLIERKEFASVLGNEARKVINNMAVETIAQQWLSLIRTVVDEKKD